jgi:membrane-associated protease RseP (regulator of RpoE activity)
MSSILRTIGMMLIIQSLLLALSGLASSAPNGEPNYLGIDVHALAKALPTNGGQKTIVLEVLFVSDESPASEAGLRKGDLIVAIGTYTPDSVEKWNQEIKKVAGLETLYLRILREATEMSFSIKLRPNDNIPIELAEVGGARVIDNSWGELATRIQSIIRRNRCDSAKKYYGIWSFERQGCKACGNKDSKCQGVQSVLCQFVVKRYNDLTREWNNFVYNCQVPTINILSGTVRI